MLQRTIILFALFFIMSCSSKQSNKETVSTPKINVMAYYFPREEFKPEELQLNKLTHMIFSFTNVIDGKMQFRDQRSSDRLKQLVAEKENYPDLKVMIACGGWGADGFSDAVFTEESRAKFVGSIIEFIEEYQLDGIDIDWEYPAIPAAGTKARPEDKENFTALMKSLRNALDQLNRPQTLTFAAAGWKRYFTNIELLEVMKYADYINLMTYDQAGSGNPFTLHHTALGLMTVKDLEETPLGIAMTKRNDTISEGQDKWEPQSAENIVKFCLDNGVSADQIVIGAAFYGKAWKGVEPAANGLFQPNKGGERGANYRKLREEFINKNGFTRHWDPVAKAPYLYSPVDSVFITYDDPESVALKTRFAIDSNLAGIMFWELGGDSSDDNSLLGAIYNESIK